MNMSEATIQAASIFPRKTKNSRQTRANSLAGLMRILEQKMVVGTGFEPVSPPWKGGVLDP